MDMELILTYVAFLILAFFRNQVLEREFEIIWAIAWILLVQRTSSD